MEMVYVTPSSKWSRVILAKQMAISQTPTPNNFTITESTRWN